MNCYIILSWITDNLLDNYYPKKRWKTIGDKIKKLISEKGMTQEELARKADIPYATLLKIISGSVENPTIKTMQKLAIALEVAVDDLSVQLCEILQ